MNPVPRVILAGGRASAELAAEIKCTVRALALFRGRRLLDLVVDALAAGDPAPPVSVIGDVDDDPAYARIPDQGDFVSNVMAGVKAHRDAEWILITSADMPFLTSAVVAEFERDGRALAADRSADLIFPVVPVAACYARYPGIKRTAVRLRDGTFTGGNLMLARPAFLLETQELLGRAYGARKHPFRLAAMLGPPTVARLLVSQLAWPAALSVAQLERAAGRLVGGRVAALVSGSPELATDLDRPSDFVAAARFAGDAAPVG
jgi:molybdopterin-guanine dinucleotide biosynthesis protein A